MDQPGEKKQERRHKERIRVRVREVPPGHTAKRLYRAYGRYVLLAAAVVVAGLLVWLILGHIMPTLERPPPSN